MRRIFVPRAAYTSFEIGPRIGDCWSSSTRPPRSRSSGARAAAGSLRQQKLGDILLTRRVVTPDQLLEAIEQQAKMPMVRIGEALIALGLITEAQLEEALAQQQADRSVPLGELLVRSGVVSRAGPADRAGAQDGLPAGRRRAPSRPRPRRCASSATRSPPRLQALPLMLRDGAPDRRAGRPVARAPRSTSSSSVAQMQGRAGAGALPRQIERAARRLRRRSAPTIRDRGRDGDSRAGDRVRPRDTEQAGRDRSSSEGAASATDDDQPIEQCDNSLVRLINNMIVEAHAQGVSDIHIESQPGREKIRIRFRKDGVLRTYLELPHTYRNAMIARVKIMCDLDISERRKPQDGKINFAKFSPRHRLELRVATIPTNNGLEDVVLRLLASAKPMPIDRLGLSPQQPGAR